MSDTTDRDTLADLIGDWINSANETAQEILDAGWRPPARVIETAEELDAIDWPCAVREITPKGELEFFPEIWESPFQTDGWNRYGRMFDEADCTPRLPVEVLPEPIGDDR